MRVVTYFFKFNRCPSKNAYEPLNSKKYLLLKKVSQKKAKIILKRVRISRITIVLKTVCALELKLKAGYSEKKKISWIIKSFYVLLNSTFSMLSAKIIYANCEKC